MKQGVFFRYAVVFSFCAVLSILAEDKVCAGEIEELYNNGEVSGVIKEYKALADRGDIKGCLNLAVIFKDIGHYDQAIEILNKALPEFRDNQDFLILLARVYYLNCQPDLAVPVLEQIADKSPDCADAFLNLGLCYKDQGDFRQAQAYFKKAVFWDKENAAAHLYLADLCFQEGHLPEAIEEYKKVVLLDPSIISAQRQLGEAFLKTENFKEAREIYQKLAVIEPDNKMAQVRLKEISQRLGKDFFAELAKERAAQKKKKRVFVKPFPEGEKAVILRIGLIKDFGGELEFKASAPFDIKSEGKRILPGEEGKNYRISIGDGGRISVSADGSSKIAIQGKAVIGLLEPQGAITLFDLQSGSNNFWSGASDCSYRGAIEINAAKNGLTLVNIISLEEYLYSVVPSEMFSYWPKEALKAQAVASRSEAMAKLGRHKNDGFDFCADVHCQSYRGVEAEAGRTNEAVDQTRGRILTYKGRPIDAIYSNNCGGHSQGNIFANAEEIGYLEGSFDGREDKDLVFPLSPVELDSWIRGVPSGVFCAQTEKCRMSDFRWVRIYKADELERLVRKTADIGRPIKVIILQRQPSGHASAVKIIGTGGACILRKELNIRQALGNLRSAMFKVEARRGPDKMPEEFIFFGGGWGHGVGMCQRGACAMAEQGYSYEEILAHYFHNTELH